MTTIDQPHPVLTTLTPVRERPRAAEAIAGARAMLPWLIGVVPFGMVIGMNARTSGVSTAVGLATGATIYSGSAQLAAIHLLEADAGITVVVVSVLVINARLVLFGSSIAPYWRSTGKGFRAAAAYLLVDPSYVVGMHRYGEDRPGGHTHYLAAGIVLFGAWHLAMFTGAALGDGLPAWLALQYAVPLFLLAEVADSVSSRPALTAALAAAAVAVVSGALPLHSGLLVAVAVGIASAIASERRGA